MAHSADLVLGNLPPVDPKDYRALNEQLFKESDQTCVIIDDDPTGNQTVHGIPLLAQWNYKALEEEFHNRSKAFFILTNSRALTEEESYKIGKEIAENLNRAAAAFNRQFVMVSRSDSTLRGHFPAEIKALEPALPMAEATTFLIPAMFEGNRVTVNDIHYLRDGETFIPVSETPFAKDATFGYSKANLKEWVEEKSSGAIHRDTVESISLQDIRQKDVPTLVNQIFQIPTGCICIVNVLEYSDLDKICHVLLKVHQLGKRLLFRTSSSFIPSFIGLPPRGLLTKSDFDTMTDAGGLIVVGSYVPKSSQQLECLLESEMDLVPVELEVPRIIQGLASDASKIAAEIDAQLIQGKHIVLFTSRDLVTGIDATDNLNIGSKVSQYLVDIVSQLRVRPRFLVAKGGVTSNDIAVKALRMKRSVVLGQILFGVPMWRMGKETLFPEMPYVVFPGNVGGDYALCDVLRKLQL